VQGLCFAFITCRDVTIDVMKAKLLTKLSKGIPGLLTRLLSFAVDPLYRNSLLQLAKKTIPSSESLFQGELQPSRYVQRIQQECSELALNTEDVTVMSLVSAVCTNSLQPAYQQCHEFQTHAIPLPLAASIAHRNHGMFPISAISSARVCACSVFLCTVMLGTF
jgi:hypothetical protein